MTFACLLLALGSRLGLIIPIPDIVGLTGSGFSGVRVGSIVLLKSSRFGTVGCWAFGTRKFSK